MEQKLAGKEGLASYSLDVTAQKRQVRKAWGLATKVSAKGDKGSIGTA